MSSACIRHIDALFLAYIAQEVTQHIAQDMALQLHERSLIVNMAKPISWHVQVHWPFTDQNTKELTPPYRDTWEEMEKLVETVSAHTFLLHRAA